ncbi:MAG: 30S ribosomal protein S6 [Acidobacteriota bacterium]
MRIYEELFIVKHDAPEEDIDAFVTHLEGTITAGGGTLDKVDKWGVRKLAYKVDKRAEGFYVLLVFSATAEGVKEVERRLRVSDLVIKWLTVRMDEKLKWLEKRKKAREKRAARKPPPAAPPPAAPAAAGPGAPAGPAPGAPAGPAPGAPAAAMPAAPVEEAAAVVEPATEPVPETAAE